MSDSDGERAPIFGSDRNGEPLDADGDGVLDMFEDAEQPDTVTYKVIGPQPVHGVRRGGTLDLDPDAEQTRFLVDVGHIRPATGADNQEDTDG